MIKKFLAGAGALALGLVLVVLARGLPTGGSPANSDGQFLASSIDLTRQGPAANVAASIRFQTISYGDARPIDGAAFEAFAGFLAQTYPLAHQAMTRETIGAHSLLYRWPAETSAAPSSPAGPIGFIAHIDVVPVEVGTQSEWTYPPYEGRVADGFVWGRGALDNKGQLIAIMEAVESLLAEGFAPSRDIYLLFGHDEEVGGADGAARISQTLAERGITLDFTLDEGSGLVDGIIAGLDKPMALFAVAEKGSTSLKLTARAPGGHSSAPGKDTAISVLARAVVRVSDNPYPLEIDDNVTAFLHAIARQSSLPQRLVLKNLWLTGGIVRKQLGGDPTTAASLHTTTAPTLINGGEKVNILPQQASAVINYRIHPRDSVEGVLKRTTALVDDERVTIEVLGGREPSPRSSTDTEGYRSLQTATARVFGPIETAPFLTLQGTDTRHYTQTARNNYRFTPFIYESDDLKRIHGTDERVSIENLNRAIEWYRVFIRDTAS